MPDRTSGARCSGHSCWALDAGRALRTDGAGRGCNTRNNSDHSVGFVSEANLRYTGLRKTERGKQNGGENNLHRDNSTPCVREKYYAIKVLDCFEQRCKNRS